MIYQKKNSGSRTSNIVKSRKSYGNGHLPYHHSFYYLVHASIHDVEMLVWLSSVLMLLNTLRQTTSFNKVTILQYYSIALLINWWRTVPKRYCWPIDGHLLANHWSNAGQLMPNTSLLVWMIYLLFTVSLLLHDCCQYIGIMPPNSWLTGYLYLQTKWEPLFTITDKLMHPFHNFFIW